MTKTEPQRAHVLAQVQQRRLTASDAARLLRLSIRHIRRLLAALRQRGGAALAHGNRGHLSPRRVAEPLRARVCTLPGPGMLA